MKTIHQETIPHHLQLYPTVGNYFVNEEDKSIQVRISDMGNEDYEFLVFIHELIELHLCLKRKIDWKKIDDLDKTFEGLREKYPSVIGDQEPGDMVSAPYYAEHQFATKIEKLLAIELGVDWEKYNDTVVAL